MLGAGGKTLFLRMCASAHGGVNNVSEACITSINPAAESQPLDLQTEEFILLDKIIHSI
jgi:hypothetical protein